MNLSIPLKFTDNKLKLKLLWLTLTLNTENTSVASWVPVILVFAALNLMLWPLILIWCVNAIAGTALIPYTLKVWFALAVLQSSISHISGKK